MIVDVEASRAIRQAEVGAAKTMIGRTEERFGLKPTEQSAAFALLLSHADANYSGGCAFGPGGSLKGGRTFLANSRNKYFAIIARDSVSGSLDVTQEACLSGVTLRAWRSRGTGGARLAALASHALWPRRSLLPSTSLRTGGSWRS